MKKRIVSALLLITISIATLVGCAVSNNITKEDDTVVSKKVESSTEASIESTNLAAEKDINEQEISTDVKDETSKIEWVQERLDEASKELSESNFIEMPFNLEINKTEVEVPFKGNELSDIDVQYNENATIDADNESFGDVATYYLDGFNKRFELGFVNKSSSNKTAKESYVASIKASDGSVILKTSSKATDSNQENYEDASYIKIGTSLEDTLNLLVKLGCEIHCSQPDSVDSKYIDKLVIDSSQYNKIVTENTEWKIFLRFADTEDVKIDKDNKYVPDELKDNLTLRINYYDLIIVGNLDSGVTDINYEYSLVDASEYCKRYKDMYE